MQRAVTVSVEGERIMLRVSGEDLGDIVIANALRDCAPRIKSYWDRNMELLDELGTAGVELHYFLFLRNDELERAVEWVRANAKAYHPGAFCITVGALTATR